MDLILEYMNEIAKNFLSLCKERNIETSVIEKLIDDSCVVNSGSFFNDGFLDAIYLEFTDDACDDSCCWLFLTHSGTILYSLHDMCFDEKMSKEIDRLGWQCNYGLC